MHPTDKPGLSAANIRNAAIGLAFVALVVLLICLL